jgi:protein-L-isoaspartate(D-aspartate) O-methyltransferase
MSIAVEPLIVAMMESALSKMEKAGIPKPPPEILRGFSRVPRHLFIPYLYEERDSQLVMMTLNFNQPDPALLDRIYVDAPLVIWSEDDKVLATSSQPLVMAMMLQDGRVGPGSRVLEIGTGSGYNAGVIADIVGDPAKVVTIEIYPEMAKRARKNLERAGFPAVDVITGDGGPGYPLKAPYDSIIITCGSPEIPWHGQLAPGGSIAMPLVTRGVETLCALTKQDDGSLRGHLSLFVTFLHFVGVHSAQWHFSRTSSSLTQMIEDNGLKLQEGTSALGDILLSGAEDEATALTKRRARFSFELFLAIADRDAMVYESEVEGHERGYAIWRRERTASGVGMAMIFPSEVVSWGDASVASDLIGHYRAWQQLGKPGLADYAISFYPADMKRPPPGDNEWEVKRKSGSTVFSLKSGGKG